MSAVNCPFCKKIMSDKEKECPNCHHPLILCPNCQSIDVTAEVGEETDIMKAAGTTGLWAGLLSPFGIFGALVASAAGSMAEDNKKLTVSYKCKSCGKIFKLKK